MYELVPDELKRLKQWVCWQTAADESRPGKTKKIPVNPLTGGFAMCNNPDTWADFDGAVKASKDYSGIGFMFAGGYFGVDIDSAEAAIADYKRGGTGNIAAEFIFALRSYAEYSVSLTGIHILCRGTLPDGARRKNNVEMYDNCRFFVVTGLSASQFGIISECTETIKPLHEKYLGAKFPASGPAAAAFEPMDKNDSQIISMAKRSAKGGFFSDLYAGRWKPYFISQSEADLALCGILSFFCGRDEIKMDRLFRASGLMRPKWDRRQGSSTYGALTVQKAAASCKSVFAPGEDYAVRIADASSSLLKPADQLYSKGGGIL